MRSADLQRLCGLVLGVDAANAHFFAAAGVVQHVSHSDFAVEHRACDHRTLTGQGKDAVYGQTEQAILRAGVHHLRLHF